MGTDVHGIWQAKRDGRWHDIASTWEQWRDYPLFAWLAGVRNGYGFAGIRIFTPIEPISAPRGLPGDWDRGVEFEVPLDIVDPARREYYDDDEKARIWLGDHSHSWLTADEILAAPLPVTLRRAGVVSVACFRAWDGVCTPIDAWSSVSGRGVVVSDPDAITDATTHVRIEWAETEGFDYFVDEVRRLKAEHGEVRLVFGFDS